MKRVINGGKHITNEQTFEAGSGETESAARGVLNNVLNALLMLSERREPRLLRSTPKNPEKFMLACAAFKSYRQQAAANDPIVGLERCRMTPITHCNILAMFAFIATFSLNACAGLFALGGTSWQEEVLLHDGNKLVVERSMARGGHGISQQSIVTEESLSFTLPRTNERVTWSDKFSDDLGISNFNLMMLEISKDTAYLVMSPMGCRSYNKWGRPNPPYVVFQYRDKEWSRIALNDLPTELNAPNLIQSSPDIEAKKTGQSIVSAVTIKELRKNYRLPESLSILREALAKDRIEQMCEERVLYKGLWILPNDPIARKFIDELKKKDSIPQNSGDR